MKPIDLEIAQPCKLFVDFQNQQIQVHQNDGSKIGYSGGMWAMSGKLENTETFKLQTPLTQALTEYERFRTKGMRQQEALEQLSNQQLNIILEAITKIKGN